MKVAIVGHSFVRRLEEFSRDIKEPVHPEHEISFHGKGGSKLDNIFGLINELPKETKLVFIQSGGNDLSPHTSANDVAKKMLKVAERIIQVREIPVIVGTVFIRPNPRYQTPEDYDKMRIKINKEFRGMVQHKRKIVVGCHEKFFRKLRCSYMLEDGVHLNPVGQKAFMFFIRKKINGALQKFYNLHGPHFKIRPSQVSKNKKELMKLQGSYTSPGTNKRRRHV
ncbi:hypothetical protein LOTGIDRAFT_239367 [Lottia gigantea]|uniref:SGNH hydrolase-type esterase domain-containing protein n=1 Tax=Lottia gigantea TaxID=225164 RepID=V4C3U3_LOTGI|nr:hypothetical protein LOTGIDRAFT_239367 [Lottia gigantea]ESO96219.1 hypothetical protein LOTGIDRAFT_239367 [Lottia gigantea]